MFRTSKIWVKFSISKQAVGDICFVDQKKHLVRCFISSVFVFFLFFSDYWQMIPEKYGSLLTLFLKEESSVRGMNSGHVEKKKKRQILWSCTSFPSPKLDFWLVGDLWWWGSASPYSPSSYLSDGRSHHLCSIPSTETEYGLWIWDITS